MATVARIKEGDFLIQGELNERLPVVTSGLIAHYPFDGTLNKYIPGSIRYIRDWLNGSTSNTSNHWVEIQALDYSGVNVASGKSGTSSWGSWDPLLTDEVTITNPYWGVGSGVRWVQVDLGNLYNLKSIKVWHYYSDSRTYYGTKTEVSDDGIHWYPVFDSAIEGTYVETSSGRTIDLTNLGATCVPTVSGCTLTKDGISIEETTTNLVTNGDFKLGISGWSITVASGGYNDYCDFRQNEFGDTCLHVHWERLSGSGNRWPNLRNTGNLTTPGVPYTVSFKIRVNALVGDSPQIRFSRVENDYWTAGRKVVSLSTLEVGKWHTVVLTDIPEATYTRDSVVYNYAGHIAVYGGNMDTTGEMVDFDITNVQIEQKPFATSFVNDTRSITGAVNIQVPNLSTYSVVGKFTPRTPFKGSAGGYDQGTLNQASLLCVTDTVNTGNVFYRFYLNNGVNSAPFLDPDGCYGTSHIHQFIEIDKDTPLWFFLRKYDSYVKLRIYQNGVWKTEHSLTVTGATTLLSILKFGNSTIWNGIYSDVSIYNRALTDSEANSIINPTLSINSAGQVKGVLKETLYIPQGSYYRSLQEETLEWLPSTQSDNTIYENGGIWVGKATTNLWNGKTKTGSYGPWSVVVNPYRNFSQLDTVAVQCTPRSYMNYWAINTRGDVAYPIGTTYTLSAWVYVEESCDCMGPIRICGESVTTVSTQYDLAKKGTWQLLKATVYSRASGEYTGEGYYFLLYANVGTGSDTWTLGNVYYSNVQLEIRPFATPWTDSSRPESALEFNLNSSIGLDWSSNWSIVYWKRPIGTYNDTLTGYCIESLGCNSNSVGGGYVYWGKNNGANALVSSTPVTIDPDKYFNNWRMISLVKSGTTLTIKEWSPSEGVYTRTVSVTTGVANYYVTQHGYDLKLGGWDNTNPVNSYYRDLVVAKRAFSDTELDQMYRGYLQSYKDGSLRVQRTLIEGQIL